MIAISDNDISPSSANPVSVDKSSASLQTLSLSSEEDGNPTAVTAANHHPSNTAYHSFATVPPPLRSSAWSPANAKEYNVRGPRYCSSDTNSSTTTPTAKATTRLGGNLGLGHKKKQQQQLKQPSDDALFTLLAVDLVSAPCDMSLCEHPEERVQRALAEEAKTGTPVLPAYVLAIDLCLPGGAAARAAEGATTNTHKRNPFARKGNNNKKQTNCYHCVFYFGLDDTSVLTDLTTPVGRLASRFFFGPHDKDDDTKPTSFRNQTFKLIPRIVQGPRVVRAAVGTQPSLLGTKLTQTYRRTERYTEITCDISSDAVATKIVQLALGYAKHLTVDLVFVLQGTSEETLPERVLGAVRVHQLELGGGSASNGDGQRQVVPTTPAHPV